jgi:uncharacterized protein DUF3859
MRILCSVVLLLAGIFSAHAQSLKVDRVEVLEFGLYQSDKIRTIDDPKVAAGVITPGTNRKLLETTTTVPGRVGVEFGLRHVLVGQPAGTVAALTYVTRFPPQGVRNPKTGEIFYKNEFPWKDGVGEKKYRTYSFDEDWEIVPGEWALEFWYEGRKLGEQKFTVVKAP